MRAGSFWDPADAAGTILTTPVRLSTLSSTVPAPPAPPPPPAALRAAAAAAAPLPPTLSPTFSMEKVGERVGGSGAAAAAAARRAAGGGGGAGGAGTVDDKVDNLTGVVSMVPAASAGSQKDPALMPLKPPLFGRWVSVARILDNEITLGDLEPGIQYMFRARARNARGWGLWSPETRAQKTRSCEPRAPSKVSR